MTTIRQTINQELSQTGLSAYARQAESVIAALEQREWAISDSLVQFAASNGLPADQATRAITERGLTFRPAPTPVAPVASNGDGNETEGLGELRVATQSLLDRIDRALERQQ